MTKKAIHVSPKGDNWSVKKEGSERSSKITSTQKEALEKGREQAQREKTELIIHGKDGKIRERRSFGNDPCPPKDNDKFIINLRKNLIWRLELRRITCANCAGAENLANS